MTTKHPSGATIKSVDRALDILNVVCSAGEPLSLGSLAREVGLHKTTVYRLLRTMMKHGLVQQRESDRKYSVGIGLFELAHRSTYGRELRTQAFPWLKELREKTNETVHLAVLDKGEVVYVDKEESNQTVRIFSAIGKRAPAHCTGLGKVLLAYLPQEEADRIIREKGLHKYTRRTIASETSLKNELALIRARGYAEDDAEHEEGVRCIACPLRDQEGQVIAAVSVTAPASRLNLKAAEDTRALVRYYADRISQDMGYRPESSHAT